MATNKVVTVLTPTGHRVKLNVTSDITILQILEETCKKKGFDSKSYDIVHLNKPLDANVVFRYSGLPNNAQLEMVAAQKVRQETPVTIGLQLESGDRRTGTFPPTDNLWTVISQLAPEEADPESSPIALYMRREVIGSEALEKTTLRSLGLTGGRALIRFVHRAEEELHKQANVSEPLRVSSVPSTNNVENPGGRTSKTLPLPRRSATPPVANPETKLDENKTGVEMKDFPTTGGRKLGDSSTLKDVTNIAHDQMEIDADPGRERVEKRLADEERPNEPAVPNDGMAVDTVEEPIILGERSAVVFSLEMANVMPLLDLPDEFFEPTPHELQKLQAELVKKRTDMENAHLQTKSYRELEATKQELLKLNRYKCTVIRIQFPDRIVLQGIFKPWEKISQVLSFVKEYLQNPDMDCYLYLTPPKKVLDPSLMLLKMDLVPTAVLHFGVGKDDGGTFLRQDVLSRLSSPNSAAAAAMKMRKQCPSETQDSTDHKDEVLLHNVPDMKPVRPPHPVDYAPRKTNAGLPSKAPKWLKLGK